jgi:hypothetical protein
VVECDLPKVEIGVRFSVPAPTLNMATPKLYTPEYAHTDFRKHPDAYRIGKGEQGVLIVEPYKSEILPHWRFKDPETAQKSSKKIYSLFLAYKRKKDFVGMDMSRKFLQMGYTRARRYANHASGRKYDRKSGEKLPQAKDWTTNEKAESARIFYAMYVRAREDSTYLRMKEEHKNLYG